MHLNICFWMGTNETTLPSRMIKKLYEIARVPCKCQRWESIHLFPRTRLPLPLRSWEFSWKASVNCHSGLPAVGLRDPLSCHECSIPSIVVIHIIMDCQMLSWKNSVRNKTSLKNLWLPKDSFLNYRLRLLLQKWMLTTPTLQDRDGVRAKVPFCLFFLNV